MSVHGGIAQTAFVVADLEASIRRFARDLDVGPWLVERSLVPRDASMGGRPVALEVSVALAYSGSMMIELIEERGHVQLPRASWQSPSASGFHHLARTTEDFGGDLARLVGDGYAVLLEASLPPELGGGRFAYLEGGEPLPGLLELVEVTPTLTALFAALRGAAERWDGEPVVIDPAELAVVVDPLAVQDHARVMGSPSVGIGPVP